jgi:hypothetical protein
VKWLLVLPLFLVGALPAGASSEPRGRQYSRAALMIQSLNPPSVSTRGSTIVTVTGSGFSAPLIVSIGSAISITSTQVVFLAQPHPAGDATLTITNSDGQSANAILEYEDSPELPATIQSVSPASIPTTGATRVTVSGTNFTAPVTILVGGTIGEIVSITTTRIIFVAQSHPAGAVNMIVTFSNGQGISMPLQYVAPRRRAARH